MEKPLHSQMIENALDKSGLTPYQLADISGVAANTIKTTISGARKTNPKNLMLISVALGMDHWEVLQAAGVSDLLIRHLEEGIAPSRIDVSDLDGQDRATVARIVDALRSQDKYR